jgi:hypothetical protein
MTARTPMWKQKRTARWSAIAKLLSLPLVMFCASRELNQKALECAGLNSENWVRAFRRKLACVN